MFLRPAFWRRLTERRVPTLFEERYTTPMTRKAWLDGSIRLSDTLVLEGGQLTAEGYEDREFIYIHFMNWKSSTSHRRPQRAERRAVGRP